MVLQPLNENSSENVMLFCVCHDYPNHFEFRFHEADQLQQQQRNRLIVKG